MPRTTWKPHTTHADLDAKKRNSLPDSVFAFPRQRKEPLTDADHVRNALARFDQVEGVSDSDCELAFANIRKAAKHYEVDVEASSWRELGKPPAPEAESEGAFKKLLAREQRDSTPADSARARPPTAPAKHTRQCSGHAGSQSRTNRTCPSGECALS